MTTKPTITEQLIRESEAVMGPGEVDVEEMMRDAQANIEPGDAPGFVVNRPSADTPFGMTLSEVQSAGWVRVWDVRTREMSLVNRNMLRAQLQKRDENGVLVFTTKQPATPPDRGTLVCPLNKDSAERQQMDRFGFAFCPKKNLRSPLDVRTHMQHRHKREWEAIQEERRLTTEAEEREVRQAILRRNPPVGPTSDPVAATASRRTVRRTVKAEKPGAA